MFELLASENASSENRASENRSSEDRRSEISGAVRSINWMMFLQHINTNSQLAPIHFLPQPIKQIHAKNDDF